MAGGQILLEITRVAQDYRDKVITVARGTAAGLSVVVVAVAQVEEALPALRLALVVSAWLIRSQALQLPDRSVVQALTQPQVVQTRVTVAAGRPSQTVQVGVVAWLL